MEEENIGITMSEYIFYTPEGTTLDPRGSEVENCQLLGCASGKNEKEALNNLLKENVWITDAGFDATRIISRELLGEE